MDNLIIIVVLVLVVGAAAIYVLKEKKKGTVCIGCPHTNNCPSAQSGSCHGCEKR